MVQAWKFHRLLCIKVCPNIKQKASDVAVKKVDLPKVRPYANQKVSDVAVNKVGLTGHCASEYQKTAGVRGCFLFIRLS